MQFVKVLQTHGNGQSSYIFCKYFKTTELTLYVVLDLGKEIKRNIQNDGMLAWQYNTIGVSDGITMGGEGRFPSSPFTTHCKLIYFKECVSPSKPAK